MNKPDKIIPEKVIDYKLPDAESYFSSKDGIIYAIGKRNKINQIIKIP